MFIMEDFLNVKVAFNAEFIQRQFRESVYKRKIPWP